MFVYIWKDPSGTPFYVGFTKNRRRTNPRNAGGRNWFCRQKLAEIGADKVIIELRPVATIEEGTELECKLIAEFGRIQMGTGSLTNLTPGGDGTHTPTPEHREKLRLALLNPAHPIHSAVAKEKVRKRMNAPDVRAKFAGDANPSKRPEIREKLKAKWMDPEYREKMRLARTGRKRSLSEETKQKLRNNLAKNSAMKTWGERNGKDPEFEAKRLAALEEKHWKKIRKTT